MDRIVKGDRVFAGDGVAAPIGFVIGFLMHKGIRHARLRFERTGSTGIAPVTELRRIEPKLNA